MMARSAKLATLSRGLRAMPKKALLASPPALRRALGPRPFEGLKPEFLWVEVTAACGNRCQFCSIGGKVPTHSPLSPSELEAVLGDPLFRGLRYVVISGGEPTLRTDLDAIFMAVHRAVPTARVVLSTSAAMPERLLSAVEAAIEQGVSLEVGVSVDGLGSLHDKMRGVNGLFVKVDYAVRQLSALQRRRGSKLKLSIGMVICDDTIDQVPAVRHYAESLGAEFNPQWYNQAAYYDNVGTDRLSKTSALLDVVDSLEPSELNDVARRWLNGRAPKARCTMMFTACLLKSNGDLATCFAKWDLSAGNVRTATPSQIWASAKAHEARQEVMACDGCLNTCGVVWSQDANYLGRGRFYMRHPAVLLTKLRERMLRR